MKVTLKKTWISPRGKFYPPGSVFKEVSRTCRCVNPGRWFYYTTLNGYFGYLFLPETFFEIPTDEQRLLRQKRQKELEEHLRKHNALDLYRRKMGLS